MGLHKNTDTLWYSLSNDGLKFQEQKTLFTHLNDQDRYIVALGFVVKGSHVLGVVYGAGAVSSLDRNRLFARWLQKRVMITGNDGVRHAAGGSLGPDRQWLKAVGPIKGVMRVLDEDGVTLLGTKEVTLTPGSVYRLQLK